MNIRKITRCLEQGYAVDEKGSLVHRKICRKHHGPFPRERVVHHIDQDKGNNAPENLIALPRRLHDKLHSVMRKQKRVLSRLELEQSLKCWKKALVVALAS